jgi:predicted nucleic acid-binding protein
LAQALANNLFVLDAWPVMEWLKGRSPAASAFEALLLRAERREISLCISRINLGEVRYSIAKEYGEAAGSVLLAQFLHFPIEVVTVTDNDIDEASKLKSLYSISYADAFAAVLAMERGAPLVTRDPEFRQLALTGMLTLHWLGK